MRAPAKRTAPKKQQPPAAAAPAPPPPVWVATTSFVCTVDGRSYNVTKDVTRVADGHPVHRGREHLFRRADERLTFGVEAATDAPGERRGG
jgi:hypothetical protein